jgi:hypothetical protein
MRRQVYKERTTLRVVLIGVLIAAFGVLLIIVSAAWKPISTSPELQAVVREFGALCFASFAVALIWDLSARRAFVAELLATTDLAEEIEETGLIGVSAKWHGEIDWLSLFETSDTFELLFTYGRTWRNTHRAYLSEFAARKNVKAIIALPDPDNATIMADLARRFETTSGQLAESIREAEHDFIEIFMTAGHAEERLQIWRISIAPVWSYYRFDGVVIFTLYKHRSGKLEVPTFIVKRGGTLYNFFHAEFSALASAEFQVSKLSYPPPPPSG